MKRLITFIAIAVACMATLLGGGAFAATYPIAPPGSSVTLEIDNFIRYVPEQSPWLYSPNPVIGDNLGQHPGGFEDGNPMVGTYFIGVFGGPIDTSKTDTAVYLWETSGGPNLESFTGPQIQLGFWDGLTFTPFGISQSASYLGTGVYNTSFLEITSSITPLIDFDIPLGFQLNAVRIEAADIRAHNQVTAVAINNLVPEPSTMAMLGTGILGVVGILRRKLF